MDDVLGVRLPGWSASNFFSRTRDRSRGRMSHCHQRGMLKIFYFQDMGRKLEPWVQVDCRCWCQSRVLLGSFTTHNTTEDTRHVVYTTGCLTQYFVIQLGLKPGVLISSNFKVVCRLGRQTELLTGRNTKVVLGCWLDQGNALTVRNRKVYVVQVVGARGGPKAGFHHRGIYSSASGQSQSPGCRLHAVYHHFTQLVMFAGTDFLAGVCQQVVSEWLGVLIPWCERVFVNQLLVNLQES